MMGKLGGSYGLKLSNLNGSKLVLTDAEVLLFEVGSGLGSGLAGLIVL